MESLFYWEDQRGMRTAREMKGDWRGEDRENNLEAQLKSQLGEASEDSDANHHLKKATKI